MLKKISLSIIVLIGMWMIGSCSSDISEEYKSGSISGSVADASTGEPVSTVNVTLSPGGESTITGSDGTFSFKNLEAGEYTLEISKEGYKNNSSDITVRTGDPTSAHLLIERIPAIVTADRETLDFGDNQSLNTLSFNIVNTSYEDLSWEIEHRCDWIIEIKPEKGVLKYGKTEGIVVVIDREKLNAGENKATIIIRSSNGSAQMNVLATGEDRVLPILNTLEASDITVASAKLHGEIINDGIPVYTERGFVYSKESMPTLENTISKIVCPQNSNTKFEANLSGLPFNTSYYVRAYAKNSIGIAYSVNQIKFTTLPDNPVVITSQIYNPDISEGTATFVGSISNVGTPAYIERGFVYSTLPEPTVNDNKVVANGSGIKGNYKVYVEHLPKTTYYVRAYAISPTVVVYGEEKMVEAAWIDLPSIGISVQTKDLGLGDWDTANSMCKNSTLGGFTDWRLPNTDELMAIYNNRDKIGNFKEEWYWTSEKYSYYSSYCIYFQNGSVSSFKSSYELNIRAVRTIKK